ncbi:hypothetical protein CEUSTIGMA_g11866.t1 [Chlamydomonas eustigma]|uniref:Kinesin motor domain-containing protein n=1 Tax=Chlamydomonas eustigma TaxID=1157962 RepID=A0A250XN53_9CHLO|nr:hypothetical protein CEUSTIGMA_g11866.t1 [Chlamydomonas eustigma]|eukprot:GAX84446.1 hypothetical protein CEUSTIGMA_g11866.t1 [Chlamydomonas eustigma]
MLKLASKFGDLQEQLQLLNKRESLTQIDARHIANQVFGPGRILHPPAHPPQHTSFSTQQAGATVQLLQNQPANSAEIFLSSLSNRQTEDILFDFKSKSGNSQMIKHAADVFEESELVALCDDGLNKQLQRTKDGATEASRIQELAALVKLLRKCVRELASRASHYVDGCAKMEKDLVKQVEGAQLQSEIAVKSLEAELAGVKKDLAQCEATFKTEKAKWGADLEDQKYEMMRLKRELDRIMEERDRARDECKKAEQGRQQLEVELKELKKHSTQQIREVSINQSEAVQKLTEGAERREAALKEERQRLTKRLDAAQGCVEALQGELAMLQQVHEKEAAALKTKTAEEASKSQTLNQLQTEHDSVKKQLAGMTKEVESLSLDLQNSEHQREKLEGLLQESLLQSGEQGRNLEVLQVQRNAERAIWAEEKEAFVITQQQSNLRESALIDEKNMLKTAVTSAIEQKECMESQMAALNRDFSTLVNESVNLRNQVDFAAGNQQVAEQHVAELQLKSDALSSQLNEAMEELQVKSSRLQDIEGEFGALKEVLGEFGQRDVVNNLLQKVAVLQNALTSSDAIRRKLHNELVQVKGNIRVYCRVKPHATSTIRCMPDQSSLQISVDGKDHAMEFDRVYGPTSTQDQVFSGVSELVQSALDGYHVCLFSYGQTGAGKTYTMQGSEQPSGRGIIPRAVEKILETVARLQDQEWEYTMEASCIEIYNNQLRDLLGGPTAPYISDQSAIKHDPSGGHTTVNGVSRVTITDTNMAAQLVQRAASSRSCEATAMNSVSSRSHSVFMLYIAGSHPPSGTQLQGCLCLVDLAGSERLDRSQAEGLRKAEACAINQSLSCIGDVFAALASKNSHVPYRNSKLTYLLQPCLGGNGKTLMLVNVNPEPASAYESLCSLKFAAKVNGCETAAKGGAKRNFVDIGSSLASAGSSSSVEDAKRLSLPGFPKLPGMPEPSAKRMSMMVSSGGAKRAALPGSGIPQAGASKRPRPS